VFDQIVKHYFSWICIRLNHQLKLIFENEYVMPNHKGQYAKVYIANDITLYN